ncbi:MAG: tetratricopeptide repeat protein [Candidatus Acidiferrum sp.]
MKRFLVMLSLAVGVFLLQTETVAGQQPAPKPPTPGQYMGGLNPGTENLFLSAAVEVDVKGPNGAPVLGAVYVSLIKNNGQVFMTAMAAGGKVWFANVPKSELTAEVVASGYETAMKKFEVLDKGEVKLSMELQPMPDKEAAASDRGIAALNPKVQKDIGRALAALRANKASDARGYLEAAQRDAPNSAEVQYLYGVYASEINDMNMARSYWMRALELNPTHLSALLAVSQDLLHERQLAQAMAYLDRAVGAEPSSWRVHMLLAQGDLLQGKHDDAVKEAERAIELGHERAESVQPLLAHALFAKGDTDKAIQVLQDYVQTRPADANAAKLLETFKNPPTTANSTGTASGGTAAVADEVANETPEVAAMEIASNWLPPDVDEKVPPVETGATCNVNEVVQKAGSQLETFVHDVDRFTATESMRHESINKYGIASSPEKRKFDYLVSIEEVRKGYLSVTEYRNGGGGQAEFPDGIVTNGLPATVLVFHPYYAPNYEMTCEGLARANGTLAWQIHFRQMQGKPNAIRSYQPGIHSPAYSVGLKGRAWISADNYQIIRMETDLVAPMPQIRLLAEHTAIEYGPVRFQNANVNLWLPQSAEVYFAWMGHQVHRRHSFSNYLLFGVDETQRIAAPKEAAGAEGVAPSQTAKP